MAMKRCGILIAGMAIFGCASVDTTSHPTLVPEYPTKAWVIMELRDARDSHMRNRGKYWDASFDDWCVVRYNAIIRWVKENTIEDEEDNRIRELFVYQHQ